MMQTPQMQQQQQQQGGMYPNNGMMTTTQPQQQDMNPGQMNGVQHPGSNFPVMVDPQQQQLQQVNPPPGTVPLSLLLEFAIHRTYTDLTVMENLLPGKSDMDKKILLVKFANQTRQLYVRILALVKWAASVGKVVKCSEMIEFLDDQSMKFVDTADKLHRMANQLGVQARLPNFAVPAAVDVLTTGTYPRLPTCIRDRIIPPEPITATEKKAAIKRIEQMVLYRLAIEKIPPQIADLTVKNGVVHLHVPGEFDAALTLMGDTDDIPWRLLKLKLLVEDFQVGTGRSLVHTVQVDYLHQLAQSRLFGNVQPIDDLYNLLHSFCLSLQLEVLATQADRLIRLRYGKFLHIDDYQQGNKMLLSYWNLSPYKNGNIKHVVIVKIPTTDVSKPLQVEHKPPLPLMDLHLVKAANHIKHLSIERLLHNTVAVRSYHLLNEMKIMLLKYLKAESSHFVKFETSQSYVLVIPLVESKTDNEDLRIYIDPQSGSYMPTMPGINKSLLDKMEKDINKSETALLSWWKVLQKEAVEVRCRRTLQHLPIAFINQIHLFNDQDAQFLGSIKNKCLYLKMVNYPSYFLVLELIRDDASPIRITFKYHLLRTSRSNPADTSTTTVQHNDSASSDGRFNLIGGLFAVSMSQLLPTLTSHHDRSFNLYKKISDSEQNEHGTLAHYQAEQGNDAHVYDVMSELRSIVILTNYRLPFANLLERLRENGFEKCGLREENYLLKCWVDTLPEVEQVSAQVYTIIRSMIQECTFRQGNRKSKQWNVELRFDKPNFEVENDPCRDFVSCNFQYECHILREEGDNSTNRPECVKLFTADWTAIVRLFTPVYMFSKQLEMDSVAAISKKISIMTYDFKSITIKYGPTLTYFVTIYWSSDKGFVLSFGRCGGIHTAGINPHWVTKLYVTEAFNEHKDLLKLMYLLNDTLHPLLSLARLPDASLLGVSTKTYLAENIFTVIPLTATRYRINFYSIFCLDVYCRIDGTVAIRDASFSQFEYSKARAHTVPIPALGNFLMLFCDKNKDLRHRPEQLCDDPPSPAFGGTAQAQGSYGLYDLQQQQQPWAGSAFTLLQHQSFDQICAPLPSHNTQIRKSAIVYKPSLLEKFLSAALTHRHLTKCMKQQADTVVELPMTVFNDTEQLQPLFGSGFTTRHPASPQFLCHLGRRNIRSLLLKVYPPTGDTQTWSADEFNVLERYFQVRIFIPPYRFNTMKAFMTMLAAPPNLLKDFIQMMRYELAYPPQSRQPNPSPKWFMSLSLTVHPRAGFAPPGMSSIIVKEEKVLVFIQLTQNQQATPQQTTTTYPISIDVPLLLTPQLNSIDLLQPATNNASNNSSQIVYHRAISQLIQQIRQLHGPLPSDAAFSTVTRYLMENLVVN